MKLSSIILLLFLTSYKIGDNTSPKACISGKRGGVITKHEILRHAQIGVLNNINERYTITGFKLTLENCKPGKDNYYGESKSDSLTTNMIWAFDHWPPCEKMNVFDINIRDNISNELYLDSMVFRIE